MPEIQIKIKNMKEIRAAFRASPTIMRKNLQKGLNKSILYVGRRAAINAPVDTGRLRASIMGGTFKAKGSLPEGSYRTNIGVGLASMGILTASVGPTVNYAVWVHDGTKYMRARPFLQQGVDESEPHIDRWMKEAVDDTLNDIGRRT